MKHFAAIAIRAFLGAGFLFGFASTALAQSADLGLSKIVSNASPNVGDTITFTITLSNAGPDTATNVTVQDLLPSGLTFVSATPSQGNYSSTSGVWTVGTVNVVPPLTLQIQTLVVSPNVQTNTATISHSDQSDPNTANNSASATETPQQADLALTKIVDLPTPNVGDTITFTITLSNAGPNSATNVTVQDLLPAGLALVSANPSQGIYASGVWTVGTVATGIPQTLLLRATVVSPNPQTNTAALSHSDQFDPTTANNSASATETPQRADLALTKTVSNPTPNVGDVITFTITLSNIGPNAATNVAVQDLLPAGLTLVSATPSQGTYTPGTGLWNVGTVNVASPQTLVIQARVASPAAQTNTATMSHSDQFDPTTANNSAGATETPQQADLALAKTVSNSTPNVGDTITFTITLSNAGPNAATGVTVQDLLPAGLTFVSATSSQGTYNSATGVWTVGTVTTATPQTVQIQARVVSPNPQTNTATISHSDQFDPTTANNSASATETPQQADLALSKAVSNPTPNVGDTITFTVTLTNGGPNAATNVIVQDLLPAGLAIVSATPSQGTYTPGTGVWNVGTVNIASPQTLVIQARVVSPAAQTNTATVSHADQFDANPANNSASATETPQADLALTKTVSNPTPNVGDTITFTVTLTNAGPSVATSVTVGDPLPTGLTFVSATPSQGIYNSSIGVWTVGTVTTATPQTLILQATVASTVPQTNTATILHSDQIDPNSGNNSASALETPAFRFFTAGPCRAEDTRVGGPIAAGGTLTVTLTGAPCGIPTTAAAVAVNVTVTQSTAGGSIVIYAADQANPMLGTLNFGSGQTRANNVFVLLATDGSGEVKVFNNSAGTVHVIVDVFGYFQ